MHSPSMQGWRIQIVLAGMLAALALFVLMNPVSIAGLAASVIPWALMGAGAVFLLSILLRARRRLMTLVLPGITGSILLFLGGSMKFGGSAGTDALLFLFVLLFFGAGAAKLLTAQQMQQSRHRPVVLGAAALSLAIGLLLMMAWPDVSAFAVGLALALELLSDALVLAVLALRDRDGEAALEAARAIDARAERLAAADRAGQPASGPGDPPRGS